MTDYSESSDEEDYFSGRYSEDYDYDDFRDCDSDDDRRNYRPLPRPPSTSSYQCVREKGRLSISVTPKPGTSTSAAAHATGSSKPSTGWQPIKRIDNSAQIATVMGVIHHTFLTKRTPKSEQPPDKMKTGESLMLRYMTDSLSETLGDVEFPELNESMKMLEILNKLHSAVGLSSKEFVTTFREVFGSLKIGGTAPVYIQQQNCMLLLTKKRDSIFRVDCYRASLPSQTIMSTVGSILMEYPETTDEVINKDLLSSSAFPQVLYELIVKKSGLAMPTATKGDHQYIETRDVPDPFIVTDWLVGTLGSVVGDKTSSKRITKKVRDQVNCETSSHALPFRRSGLWMCIKVALQLRLKEDIEDSATARLVYKILMLRVLTDVCKQYTRLVKPSSEAEDGEIIENFDDLDFDLDLVTQLLAKLGRRVIKLRGMRHESNAALTSKLEFMKFKCFRHVKTIVTKLRQLADKQWSTASLAAACPKINPIKRSTEEFLSDLQHQVPEIDMLIHKRVVKRLEEMEVSRRRLENRPIRPDQKDIKSTEIGQTQEMKRSLDIRRHVTLDSILSHTFGGYSSYNYYQSRGDLSADTNRRIWVYDTEKFMKSSLEKEDDPKKIYELMVKYTENATSYYKENQNPLGFSQMILASLKAVQRLDVIATNRNPLLLQYTSEVNTGLFDQLMLPHMDDIKLLEATITYFNERQQASHFPGLLNSIKIDGQTFSVQFAARNVEMQKLRQKILEDTEEAIRQKDQEVKRVAGECRELQEKINADPACRCVYEDVQIWSRKWRRHYTRRQKMSTCERCDLQSTLQRLRCSVQFYERLLPPNEDLQNAAIFELRVPDEIAIYRDSLVLLNLILGQSVFRGAKENNATQWTEYLRKYHRFGENPGKLIKLISSSLPASRTHLTNNAKPDVLLNESDVSPFIVNNGLNGYFHWEKVSTDFACVKYVFNIENTYMCELYTPLQHTVLSTSHSQNDVLASQSECHRNLNLDEFVAFGSLRAGHRIQLRNLYRSVYSNVLSVEREPVQALILQTLWEVGPQDCNERRESHEDFQDLEFASEFLEMLDNLAKSNETNYNNPFVLLTVVTITHQISEWNSYQPCKDKCYILLRKCREIFGKWVDKIENELNKSPEVSTKTTDNEEYLKKKKLEIAISSALTFSASSSVGLRSIMRDTKDVVQWLKTLALLYQLTMEEKCHEDCSKFLKILLHQAKNVALQLDLQKILVSSSDLLIKSLHLFACEIWNKARDCTGELSWSVLDANENLVLGRYQDRQNSRGDGEFIASFDFLLGTFLINGYPQTSAPTAIRDFPIFRQYFGNAKFKVQKQSGNCSRTVNKVFGKHYEFEIRKPTTQTYDRREMYDRYLGRACHSELIIREIHKNFTLELLHHDCFRRNLNDSYITDFSHWLHIDRQEVYFRKNEDKDHGGKENSYQFVFIKDASFNVWFLQDSKQQYFVLFKESEGYTQIAQALSRLDRPEHIDVTVEDETYTVKAKLPRYNLSFTVEQGHLRSVEFPEYKISYSQSYGTLIGLEQGVLMDSSLEGERKDCVVKRRLIVPHGGITVGGSSNSHQLTHIDISKLRQPPFFVYEFDDVLQRLTADKSKPAWLHLAALHGATSSSFPDPFTGSTGTEVAVQILQSPLVWSSAPYDEESSATLANIRKFSPQRDYYGAGYYKGDNGENMELTTWPQGLSSMAAYDGFEIIVDKLIEDSQRLSLKQKSESRNKGPDKNKLRLRAYHRYLSMYNDAVAVKKLNIRRNLQALHLRGKTEVLRLRRRTTGEEDKDAKLRLNEALKVCQDRICGDSPNMWSTKELTSFLITKESLDGLSQNLNFSGGQVFKTLVFLDFRKSWLTLYTKARSCKSLEEKQRFTMVLSLLAYRGAPMDQIANLHLISRLAKEVTFPECCKLSVSHGHQQPSDNTYIQNEVCQILKRCARSFDKPTPTFPHSYSYLSTEYKEKKEKYEAEYKEYCKEKEDFIAKIGVDSANISRLLQSRWPCSHIEATSVSDLFEETSIPCTEAIRAVNERICVWYSNYELKLFVKEIEALLRSASEMCFSPPKPEGLTFSPFLEVRTVPQICGDAQNNKIQLQELMTNFDNSTLTAEAEAIFQSGNLTTFEPTKENLQHGRQIYRSKAADLTRALQVQLTNEEDTGEILLSSGILPRTCPTNILQVLLEEKGGSHEDSTFYKFAGALAVLWTHIKRLNRCLDLHSRGKFAELERELENPGHQNWRPQDHVEWLILELELDIMIRAIQVDVARQMMSMPDGGNGAMQLNMGEGKTSTIVPMLCASLATKTSLCRVTVLNSIFKTNLSILTFTIGGLLNRRVYTFPCRRDMMMDEAGLERMLEAYKECMEIKGVVLTRPEYRLSFRLLSYDHILKENFSFGQKLLAIENWLRQHVRDIMDESDELLNVKYQLVYTIGGQIGIDGGEIRWQACQKVLSLIQNIAGDFLDKYGTSVIEFDKEEYHNNPHQFQHVRILNMVCAEELKSRLAEEFLKEVKLPLTQKDRVKRFLTMDEFPREDYDGVMTYLSESPELLSKVLLISGYIRKGILSLALSKRWRVEYGVDPAGSRRMAVPFRAKDVAAERTEFGHPDLAIVLTHFSYYYSGLSDPELDECFETLKCKPGPDMIYDSWIQAIPSDKVPAYLQSYQGLNLKDPSQRESLFEMVRKHKAVINFWLSNRVFPRESRQFPGKIVMSAWDLCYERNRLPVTGFSGTNDSSILLPLGINQQDLPQLQDTNRKMEATLRQPENCNHKGFQMGVSCREILEEMKKDGLKVLIDSGALVLECDNEQLAQLWLDVDPDIEAAVYFSRDNEILVKCRSSHNASKSPQSKNQRKQKKSEDIPLEVSPYRGRLDKCGVFLDDQHTRGTDLKFPIGSKACVTVGTRMRRDKLLQACMRMRRLGSGHSVTFYLSHEATDKVLHLKSAFSDDMEVEEELDDGKRMKLDASTIETVDVINWVNRNTEEFNQDGLLYWTLAAKNYAQKLAAEDLFYFPNFTTPYVVNVEDPDLQSRAAILAQQCVDDEITKLMDMYGLYTRNELLVSLIPLWFANTKQRLQQKNNGEALPPTILARLDSISEAVEARCRAHVPNKTHSSSMMEEEQEKELEKEAEVEEEREVQRPRKMEACKPSLHPAVVQAVSTNGAISVKPGIVRLSDAFMSTSFWPEVQPECWGTEVFATQDFVSVVKTFGNGTDSHLRPIEYLVSHSDPEFGSFQLLVLSSYEVNELMPRFRDGRAQLRLHMFSLRRLDKQDLLINKSRLQLPSPNLEMIPSSSKIPEDSRALACLLMASGSLYFNNAKEQLAYARFLALVPPPWSALMADAFEQGMITKSGFLRQEFRGRMFEECEVSEEAFANDPIPMVRKILQCRHPVVNEVAHVLRLLDGGNLLRL